MNVNTEKIGNLGKMWPIPRKLSQPTSKRIGKHNVKFTHDRMSFNQIMEETRETIKLIDLELDSIQEIPDNDIDKLIDESEELFHQHPELFQDDE